MTHPRTHPSSGVAIERERERPKVSHLGAFCRGPVGGDVTPSEEEEKTRSHICSGLGGLPRPMLIRLARPWDAM